MTLVAVRAASPIAQGRRKLVPEAVDLRRMSLSSKPAGGFDKTQASDVAGVLPASITRFPIRITIRHDPKNLRLMHLARCRTVLLRACREDPRTGSATPMGWCSGAPLCLCVATASKRQRR